MSILIPNLIIIIICIHLNNICILQEMLNTDIYTKPLHFLKYSTKYHDYTNNSYIRQIHYFSIQQIYKNKAIVYKNHTMALHTSNLSLHH